MVMSSPVKQRAVIDIRATADAHRDIADDLPAIHGLSDADTIASLHGIGKATVLKIYMQGGFSLSKVGDVEADMQSVEAQSIKFICAAYGKVAESCKSMTECRVKMWRHKIGKSGASSVKLCTLPPTSDALIQNIHRCHLQVATWKAALLESPPNMDPTDYGWELDHQSILMPRTLPSETLTAPPHILQLMHCNCKTSGCRTASCSCSKLGCTVFCLCESWDSCKNPITRKNRTTNRTLTKGMRKWH